MNPKSRRQSELNKSLSLLLSESGFVHWLTTLDQLVLEWEIEKVDSYTTHQRGLDMLSNGVVPHDSLKLRERNAGSTAPNLSVWRRVGQARVGSYFILSVRESWFISLLV